jgi:type IV secretion system protein VirD4
MTKIWILLAAKFFEALRFLILLPFISAKWIAVQLSFIAPVWLQIAAQIGAIAIAESIILSPANVYAPGVYKAMMVITIAYGLYKGTSFEEGTKVAPPQKQTSGAYGMQKWASQRDLKEAQLLPKKPQKPALVLGKYNKQMVGPMPNAEWHAIMVGGAGTGKTSAGIIPTIQNFPGSVVCLDIKGDIYAATAEERSKTTKIIKINPTDPDTWSFNPLAQCDSSDTGVVECMELGRALIPDPPQGAGQEEWIINGARGLLAALGLIFGEQASTLTDLAQYITTQGKEAELLIRATNHPIVTAYAQQFLSNSTNDRTGGYMPGKIAEYLTTFAVDADIQRVVEPQDGKTFEFETLESPCTVYLQVPEHKLRQYSDLWRLLFMQLLRHLQRRGEGKQPHILVVMDEFPQLGKMENLPEMFATLRSRNIHMLLAGQSIADIDAKYDPLTRRRIIDNCNYISIFSATDPDGQKYFSDLIGQKTIIAESGGTTDSNQKLAILSGSRGHNQNWSETGRALIRPEELRDLGSKVIVVPRQTYPILLQKHFWFK